MKKRIKVNLRKQRIDIFDHQSETNQQVLYFKERYVTEEYSDRPNWEKYSNKFRKLGFNDQIVIGPSKQEFLEFIEKRGLTINLNKKRGSFKKVIK